MPQDVSFCPRHGMQRAMCIYSHIVIVVMSYVDLLYDMGYWSLAILKSSNDEMSMAQTQAMAQAQAKHLLYVIGKRDLWMIAIIQKSEHLEYKIM